ncbi:ABC uptake transporter, substrate-binding protein [Candidatus Nitrososphaera gargensis Ga9.2]|uniref:ABC uptake transporter, substrate-binding protein n=1 Tax=Nitrososphaera gargensis (strain Ga9.2) TaxID=1237085 RepID=K0IDW2_NITGG|nr:ABC transporter substrate-binding protein [Candidatus Nitrososphaera gargensis]AFU59571.1 ABC uptake transporter, substrate-binding protein [Candidatus Nitrososphaera gargensis Ga9.2]
MHSGVKLGVAGAIIAAVVFTSTPYFGFSGNDGCNFSNFGQSDVLRIGYFPNINHAQAVIGLGRGDFQEALDGIEVRTQIFNAGPAVIEALNAGAIDVAYVGPNPAVNGYVESNGCNLRIIAGAASGGAVFAVRGDAGIDSEADFAGKKFASPQLGNTQDVALRKYLLDHGYETKENGGNVEVLPAKNADIVTLMVKKEIDGAWVPEPWGAKLIKEANAKILVDERDLWPEGEFVTAHVIVRTDYLQNNPDTIRKLLEAHVDETNWINENPDEAIQVFNTELEKLTGKTIPEDEFEEGLSRMTLTWDPIKESLFQSANDAFDIGFLRARPDSGIYDLDLLNQVLSERGLPEIQ